MSHITDNHILYSADLLGKIGLPHLQGLILDKKMSSKYEEFLFIGDRALNFMISKELCEKYGVSSSMRIMGSAVSNKWYDEVSRTIFPKIICNRPGEVFELCSGFVVKQEPYSYSTFIERIASIVLENFKPEICKDKDESFARMLELKKKESELSEVTTNWKGRTLEILQGRYGVSGGFHKTIFSNQIKNGQIWYIAKVCIELEGCEESGEGWTKKDAEQRAFEKIVRNL